MTIKLQRRDDTKNKEAKESILLQLRVYGCLTASNIKTRLETIDIIRDVDGEYDIDDVEVANEMEHITDAVEMYIYAVGEDGYNVRQLKRILGNAKDAWMGGYANSHSTLAKMRDVAIMLYQSAYIAYNRAIGYDGVKVVKKEDTYNDQN